MTGPAVVLDACVLYPAPLRDLLMWLALTDLYRPLWSNAIHEEWIASVLRQRTDLARGQLDRTRDLMERAAPGSLVDDYEHLVPALDLPDPNDRHVLAAAIRGGAEAIVTFNLRDFPADTLAVHGLEAIHPDAFVCRLIESAPDVAGTAVRDHRASLRNPPKSAAAYLASLEEQGLTSTAAVLRTLADAI